MSFVIRLLLYNPEIRFAPAGYPDSVPIINIGISEEGTPKSLIVILSNIVLCVCTLKSSQDDITMNGNSEGITVLNQSKSVLYAAEIIRSVKRIILIIKNAEKSALKTDLITFFNEKPHILSLYIYAMSIQG